MFSAAIWRSRCPAKSNEITTVAIPASVELEPETRSGFFVHYDNGQTAEVSWSFIRELPPKK